MFLKETCLKFSFSTIFFKTCFLNHEKNNLLKQVLVKGIC